MEDEEDSCEEQDQREQADRRKEWAEVVVGVYYLHCSVKCYEANGDTDEVHTKSQREAEAAFLISGGGVFVLDLAAATLAEIFFFIWCWSIPLGTLGFSLIVFLD